MLNLFLFTYIFIFSLTSCLWPLSPSSALKQSQFKDLVLNVMQMGHSTPADDEHEEALLPRQAEESFRKISEDMRSFIATPEQGFSALVGCSWALFNTFSSMSSVLKIREMYERLNQFKTEAHENIDRLRGMGVSDPKIPDYIENLNRFIALVDLIRLAVFLKFYDKSLGLACEDVKPLDLVNFIESQGGNFQHTDILMLLKYVFMGKEPLRLLKQIEDSEGDADKIRDSFDREMRMQEVVREGIESFIQRFMGGAKFRDVRTLFYEETVFAMSALGNNAWLRRYQWKAVEDCGPAMKVRVLCGIPDIHRNSQENEFIAGQKERLRTEDKIRNSDLALFYELAKQDKGFADEVKAKPKQSAGATLVYALLYDREKVKKRAKKVLKTKHIKKNLNAVVLAVFVLMKDYLGGWEVSRADKFEKEVEYILHNTTILKDVDNAYSSLKFGDIRLRNQDSIQNMGTVAHELMHRILNMQNMNSLTGHQKDFHEVFADLGAQRFLQEYIERILPAAQRDALRDDQRMGYIKKYDLKNKYEKIKLVTPVEEGMRECWLRYKDKLMGAGLVMPSSRDDVVEWNKQTATFRELETFFSRADVRSVNPGTFEEDKARIVSLFGASVIVGEEEHNVARMTYFKLIKFLERDKHWFDLRWMISPADLNAQTDSFCCARLPEYVGALF